LHNCPESETTALLYAQHWADSNAKPDAQAARKLEETQGSEEAKAMNLVLRFNRIGNLSGNSLNGLLYQISLSRWGK